MGQQVTAFDIHTDLEGCISGRVEADKRIDRALISHATGDGHAMPFDDNTFGHALCYDTLHHMHDYDKVFSEFARVLKPGGRAIFVEPGAKHSTSPETIEFMKLKSHDPTWIERDIVLEDINRCATASGLSSLAIVPMQHPSTPTVFSCVIGESSAGETYGYGTCFLRRWQRPTTISVSFSIARYPANFRLLAGFTRWSCVG